MVSRLVSYDIWPVALYPTELLAFPAPPNLRRGIPACTLRVSVPDNNSCLLKRFNTRSTQIHSPNSICRRQEVIAPRMLTCSFRVTAGNCLLWMQLDGGDCGMTSVGSEPRRYLPVKVEGYLPQPCRSLQDIVLQASGHIEA